LTITSVLAACEHDSSAWKEKITARAQTFESHPDEANLRKLLNLHSDGESMSFKLALVGKAFAGNPALFEEVGQNLTTERERLTYRLLAEWGDGVFEYFPEYEPESFAEVFRESTWLEKHRTTQNNAD
jgi:hypothetical protein